MKREDNVQINWNLRKHHDAGNLYQVSIQIPTNVGWIDDVYLMLEDGNGGSEYNQYYYYRNHFLYILWLFEL